MRKSVFGTMLVMALLQASVARATTPEWVEGEWIGGFEGSDGTVYVSANFREEDGRIAGSLDLPIKGNVALGMERLRVTDAAVSFEVRSAQANLLFEGRRRDGRRVSGSVRQAYATSSFELLKVATLTPARLDALAGNYEIEPGHAVLIARNASGLMYLDSAAGRLGALYPLDDRTLVGGPSVGSGYPIDLTIAVTSEAGGAVQSISWERRGRDPLPGVRRTLYRTEQIGYYSGNIRLSGTLVLPNGPGPHPAVVMIHGSGPATRDALRPWADVYARAGVAVLIHDKRGTGASTGNWARASFADLADDALAGLAYLRSRSEIDPAQIGLHGMSLGSWVAPLAAQRDRQLAFIIAESAPALTPIEHERLRVEHQLRADGFARDVIVRALAFMDQKFEVARTGQGWEDLNAVMGRAAREGWVSYINPPSSLESLQWHWQHVLSYDPLPALERLTCPVLVLYGALDSIVPASVHRARMEAALKRSGTRDVTIKVFERANHAFLEAVTGGRREGPALRGFVAGYLGTHIEWLGTRVQRAAAFMPAATVTTTLLDDSLDSFLPFMITGGPAPSYLPRAPRLP